MHVLEIVSMLLVVALSMIVRLPHRHDHCICNYRLESRASSANQAMCERRTPLADHRGRDLLDRRALLGARAQECWADGAVSRRPAVSRSFLRPTLACVPTYW